MSITQCWTITQHAARRLLHPVRHLRGHGVGHPAARPIAVHVAPKSPITIVRLVCRKLPEALGPVGKAALVGGAAMTFPTETATPPTLAPIALPRAAPSAAPVVPPVHLIPPLARIDFPLAPPPQPKPSTVPPPIQPAPVPPPIRPVLIPVGHPPIIDTTAPGTTPRASPVPEPSSGAVLAAGLLGLWSVSRRLRRSVGGSGSERIQA